MILKINIAGWSSLEARRAHNPKVIGSNPIPATYAQIAQLVEQRTENPRVAGSIPALGIFCCTKAGFKFFATAKSGRISCLLSQKTLHRIPGNSRMDTVQSFFRRITAQENISFLQIFDDLPCFIIKFSISEIVLFIFFGNLPNDFTRISCCNRPVRNVLCYNTSAADNNVISDMYTW